MTFVEIVATLGLYFYLRYRNRLKDRDTDTPEAQKQRLTSLDVIGDAHPGIYVTHKDLKEFSCIVLPRMLTCCTIRFSVYSVNIRRLLPEAVLKCRSK
jgi:hypothetical protein